MTSALRMNPAYTAVTRNWGHFINGEFEKGDRPRTLLDPGTGRDLCQVTDASRQQVESAIQSARSAFDTGQWPRMTAQERSRLLFKVADKIDQRSEELALIETLNSGKPIRESRSDIAESANCIRYFAGLITTPLGQSVDVPAPSFTQVVREPIGVCALIVPWNYPLLTAVWKIAPALAAGNTCVLKPSEYTPLSALLLAEIFQSLELPAGVLNLVCGDGPGVGELLANSRLVDKISFTGSARTGRLVAQAAIASNLKKVTLELGGKSPMVVFDDVNLEEAVDYALYAIFVHAGQVCSAGSRFIISDRIHDEFLSRFVERSKRIQIGHGLEPETEMGPVVSDVQRNRILEYIKIGSQEGARLVAGGGRPDGAKYRDGYFIAPTVFADVSLGMRIVQEEIFGPVAVVERFRTEQEAIQLANGTTYGLATAVFTNDTSRALRVVKSIRAGVTWLNGFHSCFNECPFGGYKESGWGRECGTYGMEAYTELKQINVNLDPSPIGWFAKR